MGVEREEASSSSPPLAPMAAAESNDLRAMQALLRSMGVEAYEPRVLHQLLEYTQTYCTEVLADAALYAEHAQRAGKLECEDVHLSARLRAQANQAHPPQLMLAMANEVNRKPLQGIKVPNIQVPFPNWCIVEENWQLAPTHGASADGRTPRRR